MATASKEGALRRFWSRLGLDEDERNPLELSLTATCVLLSQDRAVGHLPIILGIIRLVYRTFRPTSGYWLPAPGGLGWDKF